MKLKTLVLCMLLICGAFIAIANISRKANANTGGPDAFGYTWTDNNAPPPMIAYAWDDISGTGTDIGTHYDDNVYGPYPIGFTFNFYGNAFTQFCIGNNGAITFNTVPCDDIWANGDPIPTSLEPENLIAPFWDDLYDGGNIYYQTKGAPPNRYLVVQWQDINHYSYTSGYITFQLMLHETTDLIIFQYEDVVFGDPTYDNGAEASVGIENFNGSIGLQYSFLSPALSDGLAIAFSLSGGADTLTVSGTPKTSGTVGQGATDIVMEQLTLSASSGSITVNSLRIDQTGTGVDADTDDIHLYDDANGNGALDIGTDTLLNTQSFAGKTLTFAPLTYVVGSISFKNLLVVFNINASATLGNTLNLTLADDSYIAVAAPAIVSPANFPIKSNTITIGVVTTGKVIGKVVDENDDPLKSATVELYDSDDNKVATESTDTDGDFAFADVDAGTGYYIKVSKDGYNDKTTTDFDMTAGDTEDVGPIKLDTNGTISGKVVDENGDPVDGAIIKLYDEDDKLVANTKTDSDGKYTIDGLDYGDYEMQISAAGFNATTEDVTVDKNDVTVSVPNIELNAAAGPKGGFGDWWWIILVVIVVAIVILVVVLALARRRKKPVMALPPQPYPGAQPYMPPGQYPPYQQGPSPQQPPQYPEQPPPPPSSY